MFEKLKKILNKTQANITNFSVVAIIIDKNGNEYEGFNVEYSTLSPSICAERAAIINGILNGLKFNDLREVHILSKNNHKADFDYFITPCGVCRQVISEQSKNNCKIFMYNLKGEVMKSTIKELLPLSFTGEEI